MFSGEASIAPSRRQRKRRERSPSLEHVEHITEAAAPTPPQPSEVTAPLPRRDAATLSHLARTNGGEEYHGKGGADEAERGMREMERLFGWSTRTARGSGRWIYSFLEGGGGRLVGVYLTPTRHRCTTYLGGVPDGVSRPVLPPFSCCREEGALLHHGPGNPDGGPV